MNEKSETTINGLIEKIIKDGELKELTPLQKQSFGFINSGRDTIIIAKSGQGKTYAYLLPILNRLCTNGNIKGRIVIVTTGNFHINKIERQIKRLRLNITSIEAIKGSIETIKEEKRGEIKELDIAILELSSYREKGIEEFPSPDALVIDPVDEIIDKGLSLELEELLNKMKDAQKIFVASNRSPQLYLLIRKYLKEPAWVIPQDKKTTHYYCITTDSYNRLAQILKTESINKAVIFAIGKATIDKLKVTLIELGEPFSDSKKGWDLSKKYLITDNANTYKRIKELPLFTHLINLTPPKDFLEYIERVENNGNYIFDKVITIFSPEDIGVVYELKLNGIELIEIPQFNSEEKERADKIELLKILASKEEIKEYYLNLANDLIESIEGEKIIGFLLMLYFEKKEESINYLSNNIKELERILKREEDIEREKTLSKTPSSNEEGEAQKKKRHLDRKKSFYPYTPSTYSSPVLTLHEKGELYISIGKRDGVTKQEIKEFILKNTGLEESQIGNIRIMDRATYVEMKAYLLVEVATKLNGTSFGGKIVTVEPVKELRM